jgi:hypothetical protein
MLGAVCGAVADCPAARCGGPAGSPAPLSAFRSWSVWDVLHRLHHPPAGQGIRRAAPRAAVGGLATGSSRRRGVRRWLVPRPRCRLVPLVAFLPAGWSFCLIPPAAQPPSCSAVLKPAVRVLCGLEPVVWLSRGFRSGLCGRGRWGDEAGGGSPGGAGGWGCCRVVVDRPVCLSSPLLCRYVGAFGMRPPAWQRAGCGCGWCR